MFRILVLQQLVMRKWSSKDPWTHQRNSHVLEELFQKFDAYLEEQV